MVDTVRLQQGCTHEGHECLGIPKNTIKSWRRRREIPPGTLADFARVHDVSLDWLVTGVEDGERRTPTAMPPMDTDELRLLAMYRSCSNEMKKAIQAVAAASTQARTEAFSDAEIQVWAARHDIHGNGRDLRQMFEDARTAIPGSASQS